MLDFFEKQKEIKNQITDAFAAFYDKYSEKNIKRRDFFTGETNLFDPCIKDYDKNCRKFEKDFIDLLKTVIKTASYPLDITSATSDVFGLIIIIQNTDSKLYARVTLHKPIGNIPTTLSYSYIENENDRDVRHEYKTSFEDLLKGVIQITTPITQSDYVDLFISHKELSERVSTLIAVVDEISEELSEEIKSRKHLEEFTNRVDGKFKAARPILEQSDAYINRQREAYASAQGKELPRLRDNLY